MKILSIGEILWDVIGPDEHLGGATFNFCAHAARLGHEVAFVSAVGDDDRGRRAQNRAGELGVVTCYLKTLPQKPTGTVTVALDAAGQPSYTLHRPAAYDFPELTEQESRAIQAWRPDWIYFGTLHQISPTAERLTRLLLESSPSAKRFYDVNLRKDSYNVSLIEKLLPSADVVKLNDEEADELVRMLDFPSGSPEDFCRRVADRFALEVVCVTRGGRGCALLTAGEYLEAPGYPVNVADTIGAGDAFAAALLHGLGVGRTPGEAADFANRVGALVGSQPGAVPDWSPGQAYELDRVERPTG